MQAGEKLVILGVSVWSLADMSIYTVQVSPCVPPVWHRDGESVHHRGPDGLPDWQPGGLRDRHRHDLPRERGLHHCGLSRLSDCLEDSMHRLCDRRPQAGRQADLPGEHQGPPDGAESCVRHHLQWRDQQRPNQEQQHHWQVTQERHCYYLEMFDVLRDGQRTSFFTGEAGTFSVGSPEEELKDTFLTTGIFQRKPGDSLDGRRSFKRFRRGTRSYGGGGGHPESQQECQSVPSSQCRSSPRRQCKTSNNNNCEMRPRQVCRRVPRYTGTDLTRISVWTFTRNICTSVPVQSCSSYPQQSCRSVPRSKCRSVPSEKCRDVPRQGLESFSSWNFLYLQYY